MVVLVVMMCTGLVCTALLGLNRAEPSSSHLVVSASDFLFPMVQVVGILLGAPTFLARPLLVQTTRWGWRDRRERERDVLFGALIFVAVGTLAIWATAFGQLESGWSTGDAFEIAQGLEKGSGSFAACSFLFGEIGAGFSSLVPMLMILPWVVADCRGEKLRMNSRLARWLLVIVCIAGLAGAIFDSASLRLHQFASPITQIFLPVIVVGGLLVFVNTPRNRPAKSNLFCMNAGLVTALLLTLLFSVRAMSTLAEMIG